MPYYNEDKTAAAVLYSPGYGTGWSTDNGNEFAWDSRIVEWFLAGGHLQGKEEQINFFKKLGYDYVNLLGARNLKLKWIPVGCYWRVNEYDGAESIELLDTERWNIF